MMRAMPSPATAMVPFSELVLSDRLLALAEAGHGVAIVPSVLPTHRYRLRLARVTYRRRPLRGLLTVLWDRRRVLPQYAKDFCGFLDAYMREVFPISQASARRRRGMRALARRTGQPARSADGPGSSP